MISGGPAVTGASRIGGREAGRGTATFTAVNPRSGRACGTQFTEATIGEVAEAAALARATFERSRQEWDPRDRARFLRAAAARLRDWRDHLVTIADEETGLGPTRLTGELERTCTQLESFGELLEEGSYVEAAIDVAKADAKPIPRPDVRRLLVPIGPVAVFTPSNFPLAFGVAGGDTASALAAGCPVIVKGHPAHPGTSELCARALDLAASETATPAGVLSLLQSRGLEPAQALVQAREIQAVAFTGSQAAGRAIHDLAAARPEPIPVFAEMGSLNPVFVGAHAIATRGLQIAQSLATSITTGTGQFCTKPGLLIVPDDEAGTAFAREVAARVAGCAPGVMLYPGLLSALTDRLADLTRLRGVERLTPEDTAGSSSEALARTGVVVSTDAATFLRTPQLQEEYFGPVSIVVRTSSAGEMIEVAEQLSGNLTATIHAETSEYDWAAALANAVSEKVGRVVWNGYPTGVSVTAAMQHGGPYPASTSAAHSSIGVTAIRRFLRPVAYQGMPDALLPPALQDANPLGIQRLIEGAWTRDVVRAR